MSAHRYKKIFLTHNSWSLILEATEDGLAVVRFADEHLIAPQNTDDPVLNRTADQLRRYFEGERTGFDQPFDLPGTDFQRRVWRELLEIPYGQVISYSDLADRIGHPRAARAVGNAVGANPIPIIIPCHRVIAKHGRLGGYGGGLERKRALLAIEGTRL